MKFKFFDPLIESTIAAVRRAERFFGPEDDWVEDDRRIAYETAQRLLGDYHTFVREKGPADYITTTNVSPDRVEVALSEAGYQRNLASTRKYRDHHSGGRQWAVGSWVFDPADTAWQHHVYLFPAPDGGADVYGHRETSAREGVEHLTETNQTHGDPNARVATALDSAGVDYDGRNL